MGRKHKMVICPHRLTGLCDNKEFYNICGHGKFHKPVEQHGFTCARANGVCIYTDLIVECTSVSNKRKEQFTIIERIFAEDKNET